jgi:hypothetical protein
MPEGVAPPNEAELHEALLDVAGKIHDGDMRRAETMLIAQAHTLDTLFTRLTMRALLNIEAGNGPTTGDTYMRLALRAQSQCRATLEALSVIKNAPHPATFAKQLNIANGPQQVVNNGTAEPAGDQPSEKAESPQTRLLEHQPHEQLLDTRTASAPGAGDPQMEAVGEIDRTTHRRREGRREP